jgi:hypothetical protein
LTATTTTTATTGHGLYNTIDKNYRCAATATTTTAEAAAPVTAT